MTSLIIFNFEGAKIVVLAAYCLCPKTSDLLYLWFLRSRSTGRRKLLTQKIETFSSTTSNSNNKNSRELTHITFQGPLPEGCTVLDFIHDFESAPAKLVDVIQCTDFCGPGKYVNLTLTSVCTTLDEEGCVNTVDCIVPDCNEDCDAGAGDCDCTDKFLLDADGNLAVDEGLCDELCAAEPVDVVTLAPSVVPTSSPVSVVVPTMTPVQMVEEKYAFCGDCHCINGDEPCPAGDQIPQMEFSSEMVGFFQSLEVDNPYEILCDPYGDDACQTTPPQTLTELGDAAACAVKYDTGSLSSDQCPTRYSLVTYASVEEAQADGATLTHHGACGVCSTAQDLAVYIEYTDLTEKGIECSLRGARDFEDGVACYEEVGYTRVSDTRVESLLLLLLLLLVVVVVVCVCVCVCVCVLILFFRYQTLFFYLSL